ncbi:MAG: hypothetical protein HY329_05250 [Chloroflexi bacterium]|nr:hypothetical protein [Chloroflexota bacterium]
MVNGDAPLSGARMRPILERNRSLIAGLVLLIQADPAQGGLLSDEEIARAGEDSRGSIAGAGNVNIR